MDSQTGSLVECEQYQVIKNRNFLIITKINSSDNEFYEISHATTELVTHDFKLKFNSLLNDNYITAKEATQCTIDASKLEFPLILRKWKQGDYMYPFGMTKKKKVARVLIDIKLPLHEKEHVWVIESNKKIVWIVGIKSDNRFRIHSNSKELFTIKLNK
jgi:tRNA(Ile)-lysidine synthase